MEPAVVARMQRAHQLTAAYHVCEVVAVLYLELLLLDSLLCCTPACVPPVALHRDGLTRTLAQYVVKELWDLTCCTRHTAGAGRPFTTTPETSKSLRTPQQGAGFC